MHFVPYIYSPDKPPLFCST